MNIQPPPTREGKNNGLHVLVAPLNWGLGHATRCIPVIHALLERRVKVTLASDGVALHLLKAEFPDLPAIELPSYNIRYQTSNMVRNIAAQLPRLLFAIRAEKWATERIVKQLKVNGIISDNRYGCFSNKADSILITHQLRLKVPNRSLQWGANYMLGRALEKFDTIWVPDNPAPPYLSGELSHDAPVHPQIKYAGVLTRMLSGTLDNDYDVAVVLSGPEPQRSLLEQRLIEQATLLPWKFVFIQGKTNQKEHYFVSENVEVISYLTSRALNDLLLSSKIVVCRSGYSSIMDLAALGKKALLIPTPGQTEQEYLGEYFAHQGIFLVQKQDQIDLERGIADLAGTSGLDPDKYLPNHLDNLLDNWLNHLKSNVVHSAI